MAVPSYAARLKPNHNKGAVGLPELRDSERAVQAKLKTLRRFLTEAKTVVVLTGAGISTKAGVADFRGPNGVWTREMQVQELERPKKRLKRANGQSKVADLLTEESSASFEQAKPTLTHRVLAELCSRGLIKVVISQNVDGLHLKAGHPGDKLIELHGNVFMEKCATCGHEEVHDRDLGGVGCRPTGKRCVKCRKGRMHDTVLDWDTPIDETLAQGAEALMAQADLVITLGTSLRIVPAGELPLLVGTARRDDIEPRICIVNFQVTPLDSRADLVIRRDVDEVMGFVSEILLGSKPEPSTE